MNEESKKRHTELAIAALSNNFASLVQLPGITDMGVGFKMRGGKYTDEISVYIEVEKKLPCSELEDHEIIPLFIEGVAVDVIEKPEKVAHVLTMPVSEAESANATKYRPLKGGSQITNGLVVDGGIAVGTLGCMVQIAKKVDPYIALLSNHHVMFAQGGAIGSSIGQALLSEGTVGTVIHGEEDGEELDYALAKLSALVDGTNHVLDIGDLTGFGNAYIGQRVRKAGRTTGLTTGQITKIGLVADASSCRYTGLTMCEGFPKINPHGIFSDHGDSGSVVVNDARQVVGLLWGGSDGLSQQESYANDQRNLRLHVPELTIPVPAYQVW